jgi:hypothetical protein
MEKHWPAWEPDPGDMLHISAAMTITPAKTINRYGTGKKSPSSARSNRD